MIRLLILLLSILATPYSIADDACQNIIISSHPNYPPFHWNEGNTLTGASIAISKEIFEILGVNVEIIYVGPWKRVLRNAKNGKIDFIPALKKNLEREAYLRFTKEAFAPNPVAVFARTGEFEPLRGLVQLEGKLGSINAGDRHGSPIDSFILSQSSILRLSDTEQNFHMLERKRIDYFITGYHTGTDYIQFNNLDDKFEAILVYYQPVVHNAFTHQYAKKCKYIVDAFNVKLSEFHRNGRITAAIEHYIGVRQAQATPIRNP